MRYTPSRRQFLKLSAATGVGVGVGIAATRSRRFLVDAQVERTPVDFKTVDVQRVPLFRGSAEAQPALTRRYPWLRFGEESGQGVRIANSYALARDLDGARAVGTLGERVFDAGAKGWALPWTPMFERPSNVYAADAELKSIAGANRLFVKDEGSESSLLYGNKVRKLEYLLPNLAFSGVTKVSSHGGIGSNHCAYLALAARFGAYGPAADASINDVVLMLYPQEITENVLTKLKLLVACGAQLQFLEGDVSVGLSILQQELLTQNAGATTAAYVPPGGSSPMTVLGHVDALMELAEQVESGDGPMTAPPDYIFVPLGSGATAMGLVLGCHLLGWQTKVVGTCSQDKNRLARLVVNGDINVPFLVKNAESLLEKSLRWVSVMKLGSAARPLVSAAEMMRRGFLYDNETWRPDYGSVTPEIRRETAQAAAAGLTLDTTFTAKAFHTLRVYAEGGLLKSASVLFWNTYQRFALDALVPDDVNWARALPEPMRAWIDAHARRAAQRAA